MICLNSLVQLDMEPIITVYNYVLPNNIGNVPSNLFIRMMKQYVIRKLFYLKEKFLNNDFSDMQ